MASNPAVRVNDYLSSSQAGISERAPDCEAAGFVYEEFRVLVEHVLGDDVFDYLLDDIPPHLLPWHVFVVLGCDDYCVNGWVCRPNIQRSLATFHQAADRVEFLFSYLCETSDKFVG